MVGTRCGLSKDGERLHTCPLCQQMKFLMAHPGRQQVGHGDIEWWKCRTAPHANRNANLPHLDALAQFDHVVGVCLMININ